MNEEIEAMLAQFGAEDLREGSRSNGHDGIDRDDWEDYVEVPVHTLERIRAALIVTPSPVAGSAGQAPIYQNKLKRADSWCDCDKATFDHAAKHPQRFDVRVLSAAPTAHSLTTDAGAVSQGVIDEVDSMAAMYEVNHMSTHAKELRDWLAAHTATQKSTVNAGEALTHKQSRVIDRAINYLESTVRPVPDGIVSDLRALLAAHPTEQRMSDAAHFCNYEHGGTFCRICDAARECEWTYDAVDFKWDSACGESWVFNDDGPVENKVRFCHGCGGRVTFGARKGDSE